ncbi:MAG: sigma-70 family RNA polymerase sigma factor [Clostridia bacterium]|nr:sigma-70 family RNA polymerase sigma factor [Clostridia bacterium]
MTMNGEEQSPGNRELLERIYDRHHQAMFAVASQMMTDDPCSVDDVLQIAFIQIIPHLEKIGRMSDAGARAYILKTVRSVALKFLRKERIALKYSVPLDEQHESIPDKTNILDELCERENRNEMTAVIRAMPAIYRDVLELHYVSHMDLREIAVQFHLPYDTVKKRFCRGKDMLTKAIRKKGGRYEK